MKAIGTILFCRALLVAALVLGSEPLASYQGNTNQSEQDREKPLIPAGSVEAGGEELRAAQQGVTPQFLERRIAGSGEPLWVSAEAATGPDGILDWETLGEEAYQNFQNLATSPPVPYSILEGFPGSREMALVAEKRNPDGTITIWYHYGWSSLDMPMGERWQSLEQLATSAHVIYLGTVVGLAEGFFQGGVASLLTIRLDEVLCARSGHQPASEVYLYYPAAQFSIGELNFWKSNPVYPERPEVGDRILVADDRPPADAGSVTVLPHPDGIFIEPKAESGIAVKSGIKAVTAKSLRLAEVVAELRALLTEEEGQ